MVNDVDCTDTGLHLPIQILDTYTYVCMGRESELRIPTHRKWRELNEVYNISGQIEAWSGEILGEIFI